MALSPSSTRIAAPVLPDIHHLSVFEFEETGDEEVRNIAARIEDYDDPIQAMETFGLKETRKLYFKAIDKGGHPPEVVKKLCLKLAKIETVQGQFPRARRIYDYGSAYTEDPRIDPDYWNIWREFEELHGHPGTLKQMLFLKRMREKFASVLPRPPNSSLPQ